MTTSATKNSVKKAKNNKLVSTQRYLQFSSVHDDTLVLKDGSIRSVLEVTAVNFDLKSEDEQNALILSYRHFLNALNFPVQVLIRSRKLDIDQYLNLLEERAENQTNELLKNQTLEHIEYIQKLLESVDVMEKRFFVVIPQDPMRTQKTSLIGKFLKYISPTDTVMDTIKRRQEFKEHKSTLDTRLNVVRTGLENCGLKIRQLKTEEIIEVMYQAYNPEVSRIQKLKDVNDFYVSESPEENLIEEEKEK